MVRATDSASLRMVISRLVSQPHSPPSLPFFSVHNTHHPFLSPLSLYAGLPVRQRRSQSSRCNAHRLWPYTLLERRLKGSTSNRRPASATDRCSCWKKTCKARWNEGSNRASKVVEQAYDYHRRLIARKHALGSIFLLVHYRIAYQDRSTFQYYPHVFR